MLTLPRSSSGSEQALRQFDLHHPHLLHLSVLFILSRKLATSITRPRGRQRLTCAHIGMVAMITMRTPVSMMATGRDGDHGVDDTDDADGVGENHVTGEDPVQGFRLRVRVDWPLSRATE